MEEKRRPGGWTPTSPHAGVVPRYRWCALGSPRPSVPPGLLQRGAQERAPASWVGSLFFGRYFQQPPPAGAMLNYGLHQLANLLPGGSFSIPAVPPVIISAQSPAPKAQSSCVSEAWFPLHTPLSRLLRGFSSRGIIILYIGRG